MVEPLPPDAYRDLVRRAIAEDIGSGDVTTRATVSAAATARAVLLAKSTAVLSGLAIAADVFAAVDPAVRCEFRRTDGDKVRPGDVIGTVTGPAASILTGERTALN